VVLSAEETAALTLRANEAFDREDYVACLPLRQQLLAATLERPEASLQEKVDAHIALARVYATSSHHFKEMTKQFQEAVELASRANDVPVIAKTLTRLAFTLFRALQPDAALTQFQNAIQLAQVREREKLRFF
jgi:tetratricopeptide (TPR) repeat protein